MNTADRRPYDGGAAPTATAAGVTTNHSFGDEKPPSSFQPPSSAPSFTTAALLDVGLLDEYLLGLLVPPLTEAVWGVMHQGQEDLPHHNKRRQLVSTVVSVMLSALTLICLQGQTPAATSLGLEAVVREPAAAAHNKQERAVVARRLNHLLAYVVLRTMVPPLYRLLQDWTARALEQTAVSSPFNDASPGVVQTMARARKVRLACTLLRLVRITLPATQLAALLQCWRGRHAATPDLAMLLTGWTYRQRRRRAPSEAAPALFVHRAHSRWLWAVLYETIHVWCLSSIHSWQWQSDLDQWQRWIRMQRLQWRRRLSRRLSRRRQQQQQSSPVSASCALCRAHPIVVPAVSNHCACRHHVHEVQYCYTCLFALQRQRPTCPVCGDRWSQSNNNCGTAAVVVRYNDSTNTLVMGPQQQT